MEIVPLGSRKVTLAIGLDRWTMLKPLDSANSQINSWKGDGFAYASTYRAESNTVYGLVHAEQFNANREQTKGTRLVALATCVALFKDIKGKNAFVAFRLQADLVAVVGLRHGVVVLDALVSTFTLEETRRKFEENVAGQDYDIWGDADDLPRGAKPLEAESVVPKRGGAELQPLRSSRAIAILAALLACVVIGALAAYAYSEFEHENAVAMQRQLLARNGPQTQYRQAIDQLMARPVVPLATALAAFRSALDSNNAPLYHAGWTLHGVTCSASGMCSLRYQRMQGIGTTFQEFNAKPEPGWQGAAPAGDEEAVVSVVVKVPTETLNRAAWPVSDVFQNRNRSQWQFLEPGGWKASIGPRAIQAVPAGIEAKDLPTLASTSEAVFAMPLTINSQQWWYVTPDADSPTEAEFIGANTVMDGDLEIVVSPNDVTFSVKGLSYVR